MTRGKAPPFGPGPLRVIADFKRVYRLELEAPSSHHWTERNPNDTP